MPTLRLYFDAFIAVVLMSVVAIVRGFTASVIIGDSPLEYPARRLGVLKDTNAGGVLRHIPHVLRVRVCADMGFRERAMMQSQPSAPADLSD